MSEIGRIHSRAFSPERLDLSYIPDQEDFFLEANFSIDGPYLEPAFLENTMCPIQKSDSIPVEAQSYAMEDLCCLIPGSFGTTYYVNPKQFQRILKIRQKRLLSGWTRFNRKKSKARRSHAMKRTRLPNGRFALK